MGARWQAKLTLSNSWSSWCAVKLTFGKTGWNILAKISICWKATIQQDRLKFSDRLSTDKVTIAKPNVAFTTQRKHVYFFSLDNYGKVSYSEPIWEIIGSLMPLLLLRFDYDTTTTRLRQKLTCSFFARVELRRMEAGARYVFRRIV